MLLYRDDYYDRAGERGEEDGMPNNTVEVIIRGKRAVRVRVDSQLAKE